MTIADRTTLTKQQSCTTLCLCTQPTRLLSLSLIVKRHILARHSFDSERTTGTSSVFFPQARPPPRPSPYASHRHTTPAPPMWEHQMCLSLLVLWCNKPVPSMRERRLCHIPTVLRYKMPVPAPAGPSHATLLPSCSSSSLSVLISNSMPVPSPFEKERERELRYAMLTARDTNPSTERTVLVLPMSRLAQRKPDGGVPLTDSRSDLMHSQYRLSVLQWNPGPARKNDTQIIPAARGRFHAVILQEARDHVPHLGELLHLHGR